MTDQPPTAGRYGERSESHSSLREIRSPIVCHQRNVANRPAARNDPLNWDNPSQLYNVIVAALNDGFRADILKATLPIGLQIVAPWLAEETILSIAAAFEQARPWSGQWPALAA
jgi:Asp-tRNA(Asn)/Glu-tRNA(Gln) amidotransferase A subunit family amidase